MGFLQGLDEFKSLESLSLSGCGLKSVESLPLIAGLKTLVLAENRITDVEKLSGLTSLEELDLSNNQIATLQALSPLKNLKKLRVLDLIACPVSTVPDFKEKLFAMLSTLTYLNNEDKFGKGEGAFHLADFWPPAIFFIRGLIRDILFLQSGLLMMKMMRVMTMSLVMRKAPSMRYVLLLSAMDFLFIPFSLEGWLIMLAYCLAQHEQEEEGEDDEPGEENPGEEGDEYEEVKLSC